MKLKSILAAILAATTALSLTACGSGENSTTPPGGAGDTAANGHREKLTFVLDWTPNTNHTGLYVAKELGYYDELGLDVTIVQPPEGGTATLVASGNAQFGVGTQDTMAPALTGENALPITAVAALIEHNTSGILSLKGTGIEHPKGLEGKTYATWENPVELATLRAVVERDGGDFDKVNLVPSTPTDIYSALQTGVDAIWIFYGWDGIAGEVRGIQTDYWNFADIDPVFDYYTPVIIANNDYLKRHPEQAKKFLEATSRGYEYAIENPEAAAEILLKVAPELDRELVYASQRWLSGQYKAEAERWGTIDPVRWDRFYTWLSENKLVEQDIAPGTGFTNDYLPE